MSIIVIFTSKHKQTLIQELRYDSVITWNTGESPHSRLFTLQVNQKDDDLIRINFVLVYCPRDRP